MIQPIHPSHAFLDQYCTGCGQMRGSLLPQMTLQCPGAVVVEPDAVVGPDWFANNRSAG